MSNKMFEESKSSSSDDHVVQINKQTNQAAGNGSQNGAWKAAALLIALVLALFVVSFCCYAADHVNQPQDNGATLISWITLVVGWLVLLAGLIYVAVQKDALTDTSLAIYFLAYVILFVSNALHTSQITEQHWDHSTTMQAAATFGWLGQILMTVVFFWLLYAVANLRNRGGSAAVGSAAGPAWKNASDSEAKTLREENARLKGELRSAQASQGPASPSVNNNNDKAQLQSQQAEIDRLTKALNSEKALTAAAKQENAKDDAKIAQLTAENNNLKAAAATQASASASADEKDKMIGDLNNEVARLKTDDAKDKKAIADLQAELARAKQDDAKDKATIADLQAQLNKAKQDDAADKATIAALQAELAKAKQDDAKDKASIATFQADAAKAKQDDAKDKKAIADLQAELARAKQDDAKDKATIASLQDELAKKGPAGASADGEVAQLRAEVARLKSEDNKDNKTIADLQAQLAAFKAEDKKDNATIAALQAELAKAKSDDRADDKAIADWRAKYTALEELHAKCPPSGAKAAPVAESSGKQSSGAAAGKVLKNDPRAAQLIAKAKAKYSELKPKFGCEFEDASFFRAESPNPSGASAGEQKHKTGARLIKITPDGPMDLAGFKVFDIVKEVNNVRVAGREQFKQLLMQYKPLDLVRMEYKRSGVKGETQVETGAAGVTSKELKAIVRISRDGEVTEADVTNPPF